MNVVIWFLIVAAVMGMCYLFAKQVEATRVVEAEVRRCRSNLDDMNAMLEMASANVALSEQKLAKLLGCAPDWGLGELTEKVIAEVEDARLQFDLIREAAAAEKGEDLVGRVEFLSTRAAIAGAAADVLQVPPNRVVEDLIHQVARVLEAQGSVRRLGREIDEMRKWLGAKKGETLMRAVQRVILETEVAPGAAAELRRAREIVACDPGEALTMVLDRPVDFIVNLKKKGDKIVGASLTSLALWPKLGEIHMNEESV